MSQTNDEAPPGSLLDYMMDHLVDIAPDTRNNKDLFLHAGQVIRLLEIITLAEETLPDTITFLGKQSYGSVIAAQSDPRQLQNPMAN